MVVWCRVRFIGRQSVRRAAAFREAALTAAILARTRVAVADPEATVS